MSRTLTITSRLQILIVFFSSLLFLEGLETGSIGCRVEYTSLTCIFDQDINETKYGFSAKFIPANSSLKPVNLVQCVWYSPDKPSCEVHQSEYNYIVSRETTINVSSTIAESKGDFECQLIPDTAKSVPCQSSLDVVTTSPAPTNITCDACDCPSYDYYIWIALSAGIISLILFIYSLVCTCFFICKRCPGETSRYFCSSCRKTPRVNQDIECDNSLILNFPISSLNEPTLSLNEPMLSLNEPMLSLNEPTPSSSNVRPRLSSDATSSLPDDIIFIDDTFVLKIPSDKEFPEKSEEIKYWLREVEKAETLLQNHQKLLREFNVKLRYRQATPSSRQSDPKTVPQ